MYLLSSDSTRGLIFFLLTGHLYSAWHLYSAFQLCILSEVRLLNFLRLCFFRGEMRRVNIAKSTFIFSTSFPTLLKSEVFFHCSSVAPLLRPGWHLISHKKLVIAEGLISKVSEASKKVQVSEWWHSLPDTFMVIDYKSFDLHGVVTSSMRGVFPEIWCTTATLVETSDMPPVVGCPMRQPNRRNQRRMVLKWRTSADSRTESSRFNKRRIISEVGVYCETLHLMVVLESKHLLQLETNQFSLRKLRMI